MHVKVLAKTAVVTSIFTAKELKELYDFDPKSLQLKDEKGEPKFGICSGKVSSVGANGITFGTTDPNGLATAVIALPENISLENRDDYIKSNYGRAISNLAAVEANYATAKAAYTSYQDSLANCVTVVD